MLAVYFRCRIHLRQDPSWYWYQWRRLCPLPLAVPFFSWACEKAERVSSLSDCDLKRSRL